MIFDPFPQAVISTSGRLDVNLEKLSPAQIPPPLTIDAVAVVELVAGAVMTIETGLYLTGGIFSQPDFGMISAIYNGFRNNTSWYRDEEVVNTVCTRGNCTWSPYTTAAMCNACNDVSDHVQLPQGAGVNGMSSPPPHTRALKGPWTAWVLPNANISNYDFATYEALEVEVRTGLSVH